MADSALSLLRPVLVVAIAVGGLLATGYQWGAGRERAAHQREAARAASLAQERVDAELLRGQEAAASLVAERATHIANYQYLERAFNELHAARRVPIVAAHRAAGLGRAEPAGRPQPAAPAAGLPGGSAPAAEAGDAPAGPAAAAGSGYLSAGALWVWNSALTGVDQPAGACGAADTSEAACAPATGATLEDAWRNHAINARLCAEDRLNHQALIDFVRNRDRDRDRQAQQHPPASH